MFLNSSGQMSNSLSDIGGSALENADFSDGKHDCSFLVVKTT